jgi:hypothetical protein
MQIIQQLLSLFVSLVYYAKSTARWFVVREKHCWMAADCADKSKRTGRLLFQSLQKKSPLLKLCKAPPSKSSLSLARGAGAAASS